MKKGLLSKVEYLVIGIFAFLFLAWAYSKCTSLKEQAQEEKAVEANEAGADTKPAKDKAPAPVNPAGDTAQQAPPTTTQSLAGPSASRLYVTIDKLKLRKSPGLQGEVIAELKLFEAVYYLDEVTDSLYEVNLGKETAQEPYVKIKTQKGKEGWVFGAGVHYIKKKRGGVLE